jgi:hypothetical protein
MLPEYDFTGGVRGKHREAMRTGYTARFNQADGITLIQRFKAELWDGQIEAGKEAGRVDVLQDEAENVPIVSCPHCGESYLTAETLHELERIKLHRRAWAQQRSVPVAAFA